VAEQKALATDRLLQILQAEGPTPFSKLVDAILQGFMLRETNVKDICVDLARQGRIRNSWGSGNRKPADETLIALT
jgi:hypothetical protein